MKGVLRFLGLAALCGLGLNALAADTSVTDLAGLQSALSGARSGDTVTVAGGAAITIPAGTTLTVGEGVSLNVLGTLANNGSIEGAGKVNVQTMVYTVETRTPYEGVSYDVTATYNGAVSGTAPTCAVAYQVSVDGGANWIASAENTCCVVAYEDAEGKHFSAYSDLVSGANSEAVRIWSTYSIVPTIYFVKDVNVHYTPASSKYGGYNIGRSGVQNVIIDGAGHKITGTYSGTSKFVATIKVHNHSTAVFKNLEITRMISGYPYLDITANADNTITCTFFNVTLKKNGGGYGIQYNSNYANAAIWTTYYDVNNEVSFTFDGGNKNHVSVYSGRYSQKPLYSVIYGGRFGNDPTDYVAPGKAVLTDSDSYPYLVCDPSTTEHVAEVWDAGKGKLYNDAALAMKSIKMGSLVKLLGVTCSQNASIPAGGAGTGLTVELIDGAQYTGNVTAAAGYKVEKSESDTVITYTVSVDPETADVRIGDVYYAAFDDAVKAAQDGDTLTLNNNVQCPGSTGFTRVDDDIVIDLNGHELLGGVSWSEQYQVSADLTIVDSVGGGVVRNEGTYFFAPYYGGVINVRGGRFESDGDLFSWSYCYSGSEVNLYGGVFIGKLAAGKPLHIYGGTFSQDPTAFVPDDGWYTIAKDEGTGLWTVTKKPVQAKLNEVEYYDANDAVVAAVSGDTITFFGGTAIAEKTLADGQTLTLVNAEGHYNYAMLVKPATACDLAFDTSVENTVTITSKLNGGKCQAKIVNPDGSISYFVTFAEAVNAVAPGGTVSVNREIAETEPVEIANKELTFDLAGQIVKAGISFTGTAEDFIIDSVGGGKVLGTITVDPGCTLKIRAGTYADPNVVDFVDPATDPETGRALYVVVEGKDESGTPFYKVMPNQIEVKVPDPKEVVATDENGDPIPASEQAEAAAAIIAANEEVKQTIEQNSSIDTGIENAAKESVVTPSGEIVPGPAKSGVVKALQAEAPESAKGQITALSDISSRVEIDIKAEVSTVRTIATAEGQKKDAIFTTILYKVEPIVKTVVTVTDEEGNVSEEVVEATLPNEDLKKTPLTFRLGIKDPQATGAYVRHIGHDEFEDETIFCKVQGPAGGRYVELTVDHFSDFEVRTVDAVIVDTDDAVGIVNLGVPGVGMELAAAVPFLKSGVEDGSKSTLADLVVTGRENGDTIVFQKTGDESALSGDVWGDDEAQETGTAFWYKSVGSSIPLTLAGLVTDPVETEVAAGTSADPKATLLVNPYVSAQDIFAAVVDAAQDGDQIALVGGDRRYIRKNGAWGFWKKSEYRANEEVTDGGLFMSNEFVRVSSLTVPGGKGVWYVSKGGNPTVTWTAGVPAGTAEQIADADLPTWGSIAWDVSLTAADMDAFAPEKVNLVVYDADGVWVGDYARPLVVDELGQHWTTFLGLDGYDWTGKDVTEAQFAVELLDADENVLASTEKVGYGDLLAENALDVTYAGDKTPAVATDLHAFAGFSVSDNGEFASLTNAFAGFAKVRKTAGGYEVMLTNDMEGVVTIADNLGNVTLDLNGHSITGTNGVNCAGGVALAVTGHITPGGEATRLYVKDRTGNGGKIVGGDGALAANGFNGGAAIVIADGVTVTLETGDKKPNVKGGQGGIGYNESAGRGGYGVAKASDGSEVVVDGADAGKPGEYWKAWAWCTCAAPATPIPYTYHDGTTLWIYERNGDKETGVAEFDFGQLKDLEVEGNAIHFVAGETSVGTLKVGTDAFDGIAFLGDDAGTELFAMPTFSAFDVTRNADQTAVWSNLTFASDGMASVYDVDGRAIRQAGGAFEIANCVFTNCAAVNGGAVFAESLATNSLIVGSVFADNAARGVNGEGGAVFAAAKEGADVTLTVADCSFTRNYADMNGGAISMTPYADFGGEPLVLAVTDTRFADNEAQEAGGAIYGYAKELLVEADATKDDPGTTVFEGNRVGFYGGAVAFTYEWSFDITPEIRMGRGVTFTDNVASNDTVFGYDASYTFGGAIAVETPKACVLELTGVAFTSNVTWALDGSFGGAIEATTWENACAVLVDTCVFDGNSAGCTNANSTLCYGGALSFEWAESVVKNSTFRRTNREAISVIAGTAAITNCVAVGNGETVGGYDLEDLYFDRCTIDMAYTAYGDAYLAGTAELAETFNLSNRTEAIYAGDTLRLNPVGFNPVAALGVKQDAYDFVGVKYGSKAYGSSMGAYETPTERLYVNLNGDKTYDGTTASNDVTWTWTYTTESGAPADWDDFVTVDEFDSVFTLTNWVYGCKDHGYYATTNAAPRDLDAQIKGNDDLVQWYLDSGILEFVGTGTIARRPISWGGLEFTIDPDEYEWDDGNPVDATVTVVEKIGNLAPLTLVEGTDYHLTCSENTDYTKKAVATADLLHNWIGSTNDTYYITAYLVEYLYDDVVDTSLTETYGKTSGVAVVVSDIANPRTGYAFDLYNSPTNGVVSKFDEGDGILRLKVCYYTDVAPADGIPDIYQRKILAKVVNGSWGAAGANGYKNDATLYATLWDDAGKWSRTGSGAISSGTIPVAGNHAFAQFSAGGWLALTANGLVKVADPATFTFEAGTVPFLIYAYSHGSQTTGGSSGRGHGTTGRTGATTPTPAQTDLLDQYSAILNIADATFSTADGKIVLKTKAVVSGNGTDINVPMEGTTLKVYATEALGKPWSAIEATADAEGNVTVDLKQNGAASCFFKVGL